MTIAGSESGRPRGASVMIARGLRRCSRINVGVAMNARPQAGEREASPLQAPTRRARAPRTSVRRFMRSNLIRPGGGDGNGAHWREGLGDEVVDVVQRIGREDADVE